MRRDFEVFVGPLYSNSGAMLLGRGVLGDEAQQMAQSALLRAVAEISLPPILAASGQ